MTQEFKPDLTNLPEFWPWHKKSGISVANYADLHMTSPDLLVTTVCVFYPAFIVVEGCVVVEWKYYSDFFNSWKQELKGDMRAVERMSNYLLVSDFFDAATKPLNYQNIAFIGHVILLTWESALKEAFPERKFTMLGGKNGEIDDFWVSFCQEDPNLPS